MGRNTLFFTTFLVFLSLLLTACAASSSSEVVGIPDNAEDNASSEITLAATDMPARPAYDPGTLVDYTAQTGDTLPGLAGRFNTSMAEILAANPIIPEDVTTLPPGFPMKIPIYYRAFWGTPFQILPDGLYINGPAQVGFNTQAFIEGEIGWLKDYSESASQQLLSGAEIVDLVARNFSISPRLLLALLEYQTRALTREDFDSAQRDYPLGYSDELYKGIYLQLVWAANTLNNGFYGWRTGKLIEFESPDGNLFRPDPWQTAASVALEFYFAQTLSQGEFERAIGPLGFARSYSQLFGDPWQSDSDHIPGSLVQPDFRLPFFPNETWTYTGGPHTGWGEGEPWAALDFAPGVELSGCVKSDSWATAIAAGRVVRSGVGTVVLNIDGDGDERTGWVIFYLHLASEGRARVGTQLAAGQPIGHPSCEGGSSTGTHIHIARKYNGEWLPAAGALPFVMEDWVPLEGGEIYLGSLIKPGRTVVACTCSDAGSVIVSDAEYIEFPTPTAE